MKKAIFLSLIQFSFSKEEKTKHYHILATDGGGIRGIIPAKILDNMENYAYDYATEKKYKIPEHLDLNGKLIKKMHMKDLFDMFAGTSVGSIITGALVFPPGTEHEANDKEFFSTQLLRIFHERGSVLFSSEKMDSGPFYLSYFSVLILFSILGYYWGKKIYDNKKYLAKLE